MVVKGLFKFFAIVLDASFITLKTGNSNASFIGIKHKTKITGIKEAPVFVQIKIQTGS